MPNEESKSESDKAIPISLEDRHVILKAIEEDDLVAYQQMLSSAGCDSSAVHLDFIGEVASYASVRIFDYMVESGVDFSVNTGMAGIKSNALTSVCHIGGRYGLKQQERLSIAQKLIDLGVDVNSFENKDYTPMHIAALYQFDDMIDLLFQNGAHVDCSDGGLKRTPLNLLLEQQRNPLISTVEKLCELGANINAFDAIGSRPLTKSRDMNPEIRTVLLRYGNPSGDLSETEKGLMKLERLMSSLSIIKPCQSPGQNVLADSGCESDDYEIHPPPGWN